LQDPSQVQNTAGYKFAVDQGNQAINRSAAAKGMLNSGGVLAELAKYGQGMGAQQYQTQLGNLQQNYQNQNTQTNNLANLMQGAQQFGINSGYYQNPQNMQLQNGAQRYGPSTW
jgi:cytochrome c556